MRSWLGDEGCAIGMGSTYARRSRHDALCERTARRELGRLSHLFGRLPAGEIVVLKFTHIRYPLSVGQN